MDWASLLAFSLALTIAAAIPGPGIAALVGRALSAGFWQTMPMLAGIIVGDLFYLTAAMLGLGVLAAVLGELFLAIRIAGAAYLLYLAWRLWQARGAPTTGAGRLAGGSPLRVFLLGFSVTLGNPKAILFYLALLPTLLDLSAVTLLGYLEAALLVVLILLVVLGGYVYAVAHLRRYVVSERSSRLAHRAAATAMAGAAAVILAR